MLTEHHQDHNSVNTISYEQQVARLLGMDKLMTKSGKPFKVSREEKSGLYTISFGSGGELPSEFHGRFTSLRDVSVAISAYLTRKESYDKGKNAKTERNKEN